MPVLWFRSRHRQGFRGELENSMGVIRGSNGDGDAGREAQGGYRDSTRYEVARYITTNPPHPPPERTCPRRNGERRSGLGKKGEEYVPWWW